MSEILRKFIPVDLIAIFERSHGFETFEKSQELRNEVNTFVEICFENTDLEKMYIKFPKYDLRNLK